MKRTYLLTISLVVIALALSSCAINVFKPFDVPSNVSNLANNALNAAKSGDTQTAANTSAQVFQQIAGNATSATPTSSADLYNALTTEGTQSNQVIDRTASNVQTVTQQIESGRISPTSTQASAIGNAAQAMVTSIYQAKNIKFTTIIGGVLKIVSSASFGNTASVSDISVTPSSTLMVSLVNLILPLALNVNISEASLLTELNSLLSVVYSNNLFTNALSNTIWESVNAAITLFDTNGSHSLNSGDSVYSLIENGLNSSDYSSLRAVKLATYGDTTASASALSYVKAALVQAGTAIDNLPASLSGNEQSLKTLVDKVFVIVDGTSAQQLSSFQTLGNLVDYLAGKW